MDTSKVIKGVVSGRNFTTTAPIVKEDYGLYLQIEGVELPQTYEVDFSNSEHSGTSVTMIGNADGVLIPSKFISTGKDVFAFLYHVGEDYGKTVYKFKIPNKVRPDRTEETPTPEEQSVIDQAISALNSAVAQTAQDVIDADASAQSAQGYAEQAEDARDNAQTYSNNAQTSANNASASAQASANSATASAQSASASAQIKSDIEGMVDDAQGYAQASAQSATASANSATTAQGYANTASASAQSASTSASDALTYANTASSKASEASTSAQTASAKATESAQSASQALSYKTDAESAKTASQTAQGLAKSARDSAISAKNDAESAKDDAETARDEAQQAVASISGALADKAPVITDTASGAIASFSDGADNLPLKSLVVDINPVQDLHGQDAPYPAGGGANKFDGIMVADGSYLLSANYIPVTEGQTWYIYAPNFPANDFCYGKLYDSNFSEIDAGTVHRIGRNTTYTIPNGVAYIKLRYWGTFDATNMAFNYPATVTTYSPYENICPISGWTEVDVEQRGKILANLSFSDNVPSIYTGEMVPNAGWSTDFIRVFQNCDYIASFQTQHTNYVLFYDANKTYLGYTNSFSGVYSPNSNAYWSQTAYVKLRSDGTENESTKAQLELGSTATPYEPYTGRSITINLGQTVYGGKLDVLSGELVIDRVMQTVTECSSVSTASTGVLYASIATSIKAKSETISNKNISSMYKFRTAAPTDGGWFRILPTDMFIYDNRFTDKATADTILSTEQPVFVYELATPIEIQLSANQINSLYGVNNIWADSGDTEVEYRADTKAWIQRKIAEAIASLT